ncbi:hypothetical protein K491DRAFT_621709 [Lophiostoma macrostomum CBS 122681]|uniref:Uncharacterized protein n=1 Tax=Lophiostoma macrostomum CBS 122681 TaxID=1314788 RepID=A0A6A6TIZ3_9PLEO|nr:hypothetical protein K491DRAFT_621709 [Lophiostoma macrostomum CBS 122681]
MLASPSPRHLRTSSAPKKDDTPDKTQQTPMKPANFGKAIGIDKPANVRDKIKKWQLDLEAEVENAGAEIEAPSAPDSDVKPAPSPKLQPTPRADVLEEKPVLKPAITPTRTPEVSPERPKSAKKPAHNPLDEEVLVATAPKKRVVSDSHWRTKKSPPKDGTRASPKPLPTAWVRPSARKAADAAQYKVATPTKPEPKPKIVFTPKSPGQRRQSLRQRRLSRPNSSGNDGRPASSGSASATGEKSGDDVRAAPFSRPNSAGKSELVRVRRRRKSGDSPRSSHSAEEETPRRRKSMQKSETISSEDLANQITVEYESSRVETLQERDVRERRRRSRRKEHHHDSPEDSPKEPASTGRRHTHRRSYHSEKEDSRRRSSQSEKDVLSPTETSQPASDTPPPIFGNRLEAWLSTTSDPFVEKKSRPRRTSKESISTLDLPQKAESSEASPSTTTRDAPEVVATKHRSSRRRRRSPQSGIKIDTRGLDDESSVVTSTESTEVSAATKDSELTPSPTLKRRGARRTQHSPTKDRVASSPLSESTVRDEDAASSAPSSSVDPTTLELEKISLRSRPDTVAMRRMFPSTGKRLSTIASVDSFATKARAAPSAAVGSEAVDAIEGSDQLTEVTMSESSDHFNAETLTTISRKSTRRSRLASHADLISVLSMPRAGTKSIVSARSIRTNRSRLATATISDLMTELASDETKYMRELRTLVDGVIPVLLSCVLSKSDSALAAGLFSRSSKVDPSNITKPIVDMGVSLERLKSLHRRVPRDNPDAFISWAQSAQRVYNDYIGVWRLGFEDVVVSLAPADEDPFSPAKVVHGPDNAAPWDEGLPRNAEGYVVNGDGERVDVAYMLKRPLVRLKYLAKSLKGINHIKPSEQAETVSTAFQDLVSAARKRSNDERARLEDEAAAMIDPTRARDPRSLAPLAGVRIDPNRNVRARDYFDMHLIHSSGQEVNCSVELLLRDNQSSGGKSGDVLLCEVDRTGRWLFLPPIQQSHISARNGDAKGEIVVMMRGFHGDGSEWSEVFSLTSDDEQAGFEWVHMLGLQPIPPQLAELKRDPSILKTPRPASSHASSSMLSAATGSTLPQKSRTPSPHEIEIPIGEQANDTSKQWGYQTPDRQSRSFDVSPVTPPSSDNSLVKRSSIRPPASPPSPIEGGTDDGLREAPGTPTSREGDRDMERTPRSLNEALAMAGSGSPVNLKRTKAKRLSKNPPTSKELSPRSSRQIIVEDPEEETQSPRKLSKRRRHDKPQSTASSLSQPSKGFSVWLPSSDVEYSDESEEDEDRPREAPVQPTRPKAHRRASSVPTMDLPVIPKVRKTSQPETPVKKTRPMDYIEIPEPPASAPSKLQKRRPETIKEGFPGTEEDNNPPPVPPHRSPSPATPVTLKASNTPVLTPTLPGFKTRRRSSSPLKHEYEPSTCTESSSESEEDITEEEDLSATSESSDDELDDDVPTPMMPLGQIKPLPKVSPPGSIYTLPNGTITPSQSASNSPYRAVPQGSSKASKSVASIFSWSDEGRWDSLHPDECSIVVSPGKIEIFEMTAAFAKLMLAEGEEIVHPEGKAPLVAMELTPLVPMRKSTAIDITIRSPPTSHSRLKSGNNVMLRSRSPAECAQLYAMMNHARMNNPTYIALQNARGPYGQSSWAEAMDRQNAARTNPGSSSGWFAGTLGRRSSYRKTSTRAASISAVTESSVGTMNSALRSALGKFSFNRNGRFNIKSSTLGSRSSGSFDTGSSGSGPGSPGSGSSSPIDPTRAPGAPAGITNTKCRLYEREISSSKWRDMGSARLTIMLPDLSIVSAMRQGKGSPGMRDPSQEKRIVITGKAKGETMLDVTLSESCFERVARSGIAVSVWEDVVGADGRVGTVGAVGGVSGARARVFMIQMKSERECAFSFSLLGKQRY